MSTKCRRLDRVFYCVLAIKDPVDAHQRARFGGVIVTNREMPENLARVISEIFTDVIIAPSYSAEARAILQRKKNLRLMQFDAETFLKSQEANPIIRSAPGGIMVMDRDFKTRGLTNVEALRHASHIHFLRPVFDSLFRPSTHR